MPPNLSPRELLDRELARLGRTWGENNPRQLAYMRAEASVLHHTPTLRAAKMVKYFGGRADIGFGDGSYVRDRDAARATLDLN